MSLQLTFDPNIRLVNEPGFRRFFSCAEIAQMGLSQGSLSTKNLWAEPAFGTLMLKPLQLQDDFLNHAAQLTSGCCLRLSLDFMVNAADLSTTAIWEAPVGTTDNPWIFHTPATTSLGAPTITPTGLPIVPVQITGQRDVGNASESGMGTVYSSPPGSRFPGDLLLEGDEGTTNALSLLVESNTRFAANQGFYLRWFFPEVASTHQTIYGFAFAQYFLVCRNALLEVYRDVSPRGDRSKYQKAWSGPLFALSSDVPTPFNAIWPYGQATGPTAPGGERSLLIIPYRQNRILVRSNTGQFIVLTARARPKLLADGSDYDITRSDTLQVWGLTATVGRFQAQKVKYEPGPATVQLPELTIEYTPFDTPAVQLNGSHRSDETLSATIAFPAGYEFPPRPTDDDCPPPTTLTGAQGRTYGVTATLASTPDQSHSPELYGVEVFADPVFQDNAATPLTIADQSPSSRVIRATLSVGDKPGDGQMNATVWDVDSYPLAPYYFRCEMPVQMQLDGASVFTGFGDRVTVTPLRHAGAPVEINLRATDRWLLLEETFLREQRDWQGVGHITVVDKIVRQCGIDTGTPSGALAEYPADWNGTLASTYDTPLGRPEFTADNLEANMQLGWKPQPTDTGASYLKRIVDYFSGWLMGFRLDGTFFYLPYEYFTTPSVMFHAYHRSVDSGLVPTAGAGLSVTVSAGSATIGGAVTVGSPITISSLTANATNYLYLQANGTGTSNTTGIPPANTVGLGTATTNGTGVTTVDTSATSGRQTSSSPVYRSPVEWRTTEPSGNVVQIRSQYAIDLSSNRTYPAIDWASVKNPSAPNYLGRFKWQVIEVGGAFSCPQLNAMQAIAFRNSRPRLREISFRANFVPTLKIGQVVTLEGLGDFRLISMRVDLLREGWDIADYVCRSTEKGFQ